MRTFNEIRSTNGFTLVELMISVAIIGVLAAIAIPSYNGYINTSQNSMLVENANTIIPFEETYFYENGEYKDGTYTPGSNGLAAIEWAPSGDKDKIKYVVTINTGCTAPATKCYTIVASLISDPTITQTVQMH